MGLVTSPGHQLLASEPKPHEIERSAHSDQEADEGEKGGVEEVVSCPADTAPEKEARNEVAEDRPQGVLFAAVSWVIAHAAMVDEF